MHGDINDVICFLEDTVIQSSDAGKKFSANWMTCNLRNAVFPGLN
jgi:hypothetical protein